MDENKKHQKDVRCPKHGKLIGKYDERYGLMNATFYCPKCGAEYTFTIRKVKAQKKEPV